MTQQPTEDAILASPIARWRWLGICGLLVASATVLFLGFYRDQWRVVREKKFREFQTDSESLVMARMVESRQSGVLSENGLLGWGDADPLNLNESDYQHQYDVYLSGQTFQTYSLYKSVSGLQAMFFAVLDRLSPYSPATNLRDFRALVALFFALTLSIFVAWTVQEFGWITALIALVTTVLSQWMTLFGHNLFYFIWASFLPLGLIALYLGWEERMKRISDTRLALLGFSTLLFKCLMNGFDFIVPALFMPVAPLVYYGLCHGWDRSKFMRRLSILCLALLAAVLTSILILSAQLRISEGSLAAGIGSVLSTFGRRTYANPSAYPLYAESLAANPWSVLWTYLSEDTAVEVLGLHFLDLIIIFAVVTCAYLILDALKRRKLPDRAKSYALIGTTWLSLLSPISWFLIFKGQAYVHTHTNYLAWHMPFTLFGYAMCGYLIRSAIVLLLPPRKTRGRQPKVATA